jgi:uncharacterized membrane protein
MRCTRCNSKNVSIKNSQSVWIGYLLAFLLVYYGFQSGDLMTILITFGLGAAIIFFYKKRINKKYYYNDFDNQWTTGGFG